MGYLIGIVPEVFGSKTPGDIVFIITLKLILAICNPRFASHYQMSKKNYSTHQKLRILNAKINLPLDLQVSKKLFQLF